MTAPAPRTLVRKIWDEHVVAALDGGQALLQIDRVLLHERTGPALLAGLAEAGRGPRHPQQVVGVMDHTVDTQADRLRREPSPVALRFMGEFRQRAAQAGIGLIDVDDPRQGIVHVVSPELGLALPGLTLVCPDSHTGTVGGIGALAWGIGSTEGQQAVATAILARALPEVVAVRLEGVPPLGVFAKDMVLALIARHGAQGGRQAALEFMGPAVRQLDIEGRMTLCNMAVEFGAWTGIVAPDPRTVDWLRGRPHAPQGAAFEAAAAHWLSLASDEGAAWDGELTLDVGQLEPQVSWGTSPAQTAGISAAVPDPGRIADAGERAAAERALSYMGLQPGQPLQGIPIEAAFIGSCTNARLPDLRAAAAVLRGRRAAPGVLAWVVPGSMEVRRQAEAEGLHRVFEAAGFEWRASGCSMCFHSGADSRGTARRVISSTNRNFEGRQGPGVRTHLASPATVAASAVAGCIADARPLLREGARP